MPRSERPGRQRSPWRWLLAALAIASGLAAIGFVVFGSSIRETRIGVILALWTALIGTFLIFGPRIGHAEQIAQLTEAERRARDLHEAQLQVSHMQQQQLAAAEELRTRQEVELRKIGEMQLSREAAARREADLRLEISLRREIERMMTEQLGLLREEVASLRAEVIDKLGGELRLERIETTRLIGSDLEALQHEIRRLAGSQESIAAGPAQLGRSLHRDIVDAEVVEGDDPFEAAARTAGHTQGSGSAGRPVGPERVHVVETHAPPPRSASAGPEGSGQPPPERQAAPAASAPPQPGTRAPASAPEEQPVETEQPPPAAADQPQPAAAPEGHQQAAAPAGAGTDPWSAPTVVRPDPLSSVKPPQREQHSGPIPPLYKQSEQVAAFTASFDPFAGLPRLSPVPEDLELLDDQADADPAAEAGVPTGSETAAAAEGEPESGPAYDWRRAAAAARAASSDYRGRRRAGDDSGEPAATAEGGRRRAPEDAPDDLLARLRQQ